MWSRRGYKTHPLIDGQVPNVQILWLKSDYIDPPDTGGKIRTYNLLRQLNNLCEVTYLSLNSTDSTDIKILVYLRRLARRYCTASARAKGGGWYCQGVGEVVFRGTIHCTEISLEAGL